MDEASSLVKRGTRVIWRFPTTARPKRLARPTGRRSEPFSDRRV